MRDPASRKRGDQPLAKKQRTTQYHHRDGWVMEVQDTRETQEGFPWSTVTPPSRGGVGTDGSIWVLVKTLSRCGVRSQVVRGWSEKPWSFGVPDNNNTDQYPNNLTTQQPTRQPTHLTTEHIHYLTPTYHHQHLLTLTSTLTPTY